MLSGLGVQCEVALLLRGLEQAQRTRSTDVLVLDDRQGRSGAARHFVGLPVDGFGLKRQRVSADWSLYPPEGLHNNSATSSGLGLRVEWYELK